MDMYSKRWENKDYINDLERGWSDHKDWPEKKATREWLKNNVNKGHKVLDVGCGTGFYTQTIADICGNDGYTGVDASSNMVEFCNDKFSGIKFKQVNIFDLDKNFEENEFDVVINCDVLVHIPATDRAIKQLYRVTKKKLAMKVMLTDKETHGNVPTDDAPDFSEKYWYSFNKDEFVNTVKKCTGNALKIIVHDNLRGLNDVLDGRWAIVEVIKSE